MDLLPEKTYLEINELVAIKIMGWVSVELEQTSLNGVKFKEKGWLDWDNEEWLKAHDFSRDISSAFDVVRQMNEKGWEFKLEQYGAKPGNRVCSWGAEFIYCPGGFYMGKHSWSPDLICKYHGEEMKYYSYAAGGDEPALAICLAGLDAVQGKEMSFDWPKG